MERLEERQGHVLQRAINRMAKSTLGAFQSAPQGILAAESGLFPARALLDHRQARFAQRLLARPQGGGGPEEILEREGPEITRRLRKMAGTSQGRRWDLRCGARTGPSRGTSALSSQDQPWRQRRT